MWIAPELNLWKALNGSFFSWKCTSCGYKLCTSLFHEFYRDGHGNRKPYGHPIPASFEAVVYGIKGIFDRRYCSQCDNVEDVIVKELEVSVESTSDIPESPWRELKPACDKYHGELYFNLDGYSCPRCDEGSFKLFTEWWT